jgi:hypothetical protein
MEDTPSIQNAGANSLSQDLLGLSLDDKPKKSEPTPPQSKRSNISSEHIDINIPSSTGSQGSNAGASFTNLEGFPPQIQSLLTNLTKI